MKVQAQVQVLLPPQVLEELAAAGTVVFTPSRETDTQRITSYDDTFVLDYAAKHGGVVVTRDNYRCGGAAAGAAYV